MYLVNNEVLKLIRLLAIQNIQCNSIEWYTEQAYRHYSKTYHTPLHLAKQVMNPAEVIRIQMEDEMMEQTSEEIQAIEDRLSSKPKAMLDVENYSPEEDEQMSDEEWVLQQMADAAKQESAGTKKASNPGPSMADAAKQAHQAIQNLYGKLDKPVPENIEGNVKFDNKE